MLSLTGDGKSDEECGTERNRLPISLYHEVIEALTPLVDAFEQLGIAYYIGGSMSSSLHGLGRSALSYGPSRAITRLTKRVVLNLMFWKRGHAR